MQTFMADSMLKLENALKNPLKENQSEIGGSGLSAVVCNTPLRVLGR